jgi:hypothetical protein
MNDQLVCFFVGLKENGVVELTFLDLLVFQLVLEEVPPEI